MKHPKQSARSPWSFILRSAKNQKTPSVQRRPRPLSVEVLEPRTLLTGSVQLSNGILLITGTGTNTVLVKEISGNNKNQPDQISVTLDGQTSTFKVTFVNQIQAQLGGGKDSFTLDDSTRLVMPLVFVSFGNGTLNNTVTVNGTALADAFTITGTTVGLAGAGTLTYTNAQALNVNGLGGNDTFSMTGINSAAATTLDGGPGVADSNTFTGTFASDFNGSLTLANIESTTLTVPGTVTSTSTITLLEAAGEPGTGVLSNSTIGTVAGKVVAGSIVNTKIGSIAKGGMVTAQGQGTTSNVSIGTLSGSFTAPEDPNAPPGTPTGVMSGTTINSITSTGAVSTGSISGMSVGTTDSGSSITAAGQGTTSNVSIGTLSGSFTAPEDPTASAGTTTGTMSSTTIGTVTSTGMVSTGSISGMSVGTANSGSSITAAGQGTTSNVSIGTLSGSFTAPEDPTASAGTTTGTMSGTTINSITSTGMVSTGSISGMSVGTASSGSSITAAGQGTTSNVSIGTLSGTFTAPEDPNAPPGTTTGTMSGTTINSITSTGAVSTGSISGMSVGTTDSGSSITAAGQGTTSNVSIGTLSGTFTAPEDPNAPAGTTTGMMSGTTINSITSTGAVSTGSISGMSVGTADSGSSITAAGFGTVSNVTISKLAGTLTAKKDSTPGSGTLSNASIGTLATTGSVNAATASTINITTDGGSIDVTGLLDKLTAGSVQNTANLVAGHFNTVTAQHASPIVNFIEPNVTRTLAVTPHAAGAVPDYGFYYDGTASGDPRVVVQIAVGKTPDNFDLGVTTNTTTASPTGFDLAGLYSNSSKAATGVHNVVIGGNLLLNDVPSGAISFFGLPASTAGGVQLPNDSGIGVAAAGNLPAASIVAKSVAAVAAGTFGTVSADLAGNSDALTPLAVGTGVTQANDTFQVFVSVANHVAQFLVTGPGGSFDNKGMLFAQLNPYASVPAPVTASDTLVPSGSSTSVQSVVFTGQGGSLTTAQPITTAISAAPGGTLGDLILSSPGGITANITADSIIGNIDATNGGISGTIEATVGDIGRALTDANGNITGVTSIQAGGGGLTSTGQIIAKGNLVSQVAIKSGLDGVIAADGDIGVIQTVTVNGVAVAKTNPDGSLIRFGGITVSTGGLNGEVIALGNVFGDISVNGGLSGRIAVHGHPGEFGLAASRFGILGNVAIGGGIGTTGAVVSDGVIGDSTGAGTFLTTSGTDKGIFAAGQGINFGATGSLNQAGLFNPAIGPDLAAIDAIFTNKSVKLDVTDPAQLNLIIQDLLALTVTNGKLTGTTP
jgi:hypothetical protein